MSNDKSYALLILAFLIVVIVSKKFGAVLLELLLKLTRPGATVSLLAFLVFVYSKGFDYTFIMLAILTVYLLRDIWSNWIKSDARRLHQDISTDEARFDPAASIDIQMANKSVVHEAPPSYNTRDLSTLLVFPPSSATLEEMNG
jgi:uncharacterized membrane protein